MTIISNWKLTYNPTASPVVVVDYGDELTQEPEWGKRRGLNVVPIKYGAPFLEMTDNDVHVLDVSLVKYADSDALARRDMMSVFTHGVGVLGKVPLRLEIAGLPSTRFDWTAAVFDFPRVRRLIDAGHDGKAAWSVTLPITAVGMTRTVT